MTHNLIQLVADQHTLRCKVRKNTSIFSPNIQLRSCDLEFIGIKFVILLSGALNSILTDNGALNGLIDQTNSGSTSSLLGLQPSANGSPSAFASFGKGLSLGMLMIYST